MIKPRTREGFLIDWDLAHYVSELGIGAVEPDRSVCTLKTFDEIDLLQVVHHTGHLAISFRTQPSVSKETIPSLR